MTIFLLKSRGRVIDAFQNYSKAEEVAIEMLKAHTPHVRVQGIDIGEFTTKMRVSYYPAPSFIIEPINVQ